ncbi:1,4-dihydroxy-2-naphthoate polyprenyltransferase [Peribacillus cavernae]|uniref:1,4-dihydroxy-2-naphthoate octaprenyltransferase n=1 Tax=Peribacillus cavernae TaxID=1674310 RepID=A0A433HUE6_9BACI|nr:1,4-dihydroxy-2-naphthoate polyprenyltransferase [Peribacillus cavernae]MDQ0220254.1 1,4-dihydroxy-2-naphthoate octaprenyltransferase [Peribacillus cavernae]RUQ31919.1 1,4-dihydroxy-2-naphthoate polyprenyltransferase [Peribacillus cavernae]
MQTRIHTDSAPLLQDNKPNWRVLWQLTRPHTLTAGFVPVLIGTALAIQTSDINIPLFIAMLIACLLIQAATNMFNEYYDFKRGLDNAESIGIGGAIVRDGMSPSIVLRLALSLYGIATLIGVYICMESSWWLALIGLICMATGYLYTGGPWPISSTPFGEIFAGLFMGFLIILLSFFIQTGNVSTVSILVAIPIGILVGLINLSNNIRDLDGDKKNGRKTLAILIGREKAVSLLGGMFTVSYMWIIGLTAMGIVSPWVLLVFLSVPKAIKATKGFIGKTIPTQMMPAMKATAQTNTIFGFLLSIGLFISYFI